MGGGYSKLIAFKEIKDFNGLMVDNPIKNTTEPLKSPSVDAEVVTSKPEVEIPKPTPEAIALKQLYENNIAKINELKQKIKNLKNSNGQLAVFYSNISALGLNQLESALKGIDLDKDNAFYDGDTGRILSLKEQLLKISEYFTT
ncbi:hypothetical protein [Helicobacter sp. 13S00477-4]|uniref:hypothetical protein n=1 Tax=Helicobacter sp. 13S00477-4 TaxID=1905759 RepID=UPI000BA7E3BF|nr:hypothetical protein [Helicobacter sp. 13S00477-4]PAF50501.1 hypothetical protein BKH44_08070 [Helicobacter sp. 13S00477-4]